MIETWAIYGPQEKLPAVCGCQFPHGNPPTIAWCRTHDAAMDLLAACEAHALVERHTGACSDCLYGHGCTEGTNLLTVASRATRAAITKARGKDKA